MKTVYSYLNIAGEICYTNGDTVALRAGPEDFEFRLAEHPPILHPKYGFPTQSARYVADVSGPDAEAFVHLVLTDALGLAPKRVD